MVSGQQNQSKNRFQEEINIKKVFFSYAKHWKWFALSCMTFFVLAFFKLRYTPPEYNAYAKIMIVDDGTSSAPSMEVLKDLKRYSESEGKKTEDEIEALKSRGVLESVVKKLSLNIQYSSIGRIHETLLYKKAPININFIASDSIIDNSQFNFSLNVISEIVFNFIEENGE